MTGHAPLGSAGTANFHDFLIDSIDIVKLSAIFRLVRRIIFRQLVIHGKNWSFLRRTAQVSRIGAVSVETSRFSFLVPVLL